MRKIFLTVPRRLFSILMKQPYWMKVDQTNTGSTLLKVSCFLERRSDLSHEDFFRYWTRKHVPLLVKPMPNGPKIVHSIHLHTIPEKVPGLLTAPYDGVAEIWLENLEDVKALFANEYYITVAGKDEENFLDRSKTTFLFSHEKKIF